MNKWTQQELDILSRYYLDLNIEELQDKIPKRTKGAIQRKASSLGLTNFTLKQSQSQRKYIWNTSFFSKITNNTSYWAGFIAADGHLDGRDKGIKIHIQAKDRGLLKSFVCDIKWAGNIKDKNNYARVDLWGAHQAHQDLKRNWNIDSGNKTLSLKPPKLDELEHKLSYILGLYDGDGGLQKEYGIRFCGTLSMMRWVSSELGSLCNKCPIPRLNGKSQVNYAIQWGSKHHSLILHQIFNNLNISQRLKRKMYIYEQT